MTVPDSVVVTYWGEHRAQLRQSESQRAVLTNYVLAVAAALSGLVVQQRFRAQTLPLSVLVFLIGLYGALAVRRFSADTGALRTARAALQRGDAVMMFPEGTRSRDQRLHPGLPGAAGLSLSKISNRPSLA